MSSILKVDTINDQNGNLIISKDSGGGGFLSPYASSSTPIIYTVTVASKTAAHPYNGVGSSLGYLINGIEAPIIEIKGNDTSKPYHYKFDQADASNSGHPLLFYNNASKTTAFTTGVTTSGTPGQAGAYTMIAVDSDTPNILYYQCSQHGQMGNHTFATSPTINTGVFLKMPTTDGTNGQSITTNGSGTLAFATTEETKPTVANVSQTIPVSTATTISITGTNFVSIPVVEFVNGSTGAITNSNTVAFTNATTLSVNVTLASGNYFVRIENPDGNAGRSTNNIITASTSPSFSTNAGSLGTVQGDFSGAVATVAASSDSAVTFSETTNVLTNASQANCALNASTGAITTTDFGGGSTTAQTYNFTLRATDQEAQTVDRAFSLTSQFFTGLTHYLVVAGGGGGGNGGGGAGGYRTNYGGTAIQFAASTTYTITVGNGGSSGAFYGVGGSGNGSSLSGSGITTISSAGGGGGGSFSASNAKTGGSGGGGGGADSGGNLNNGASGNNPSTSPIQGYNGGYGFGQSTAGGGGGGGGAGANGGNGAQQTGGNGGSGVSNSINGSAVYYAGGGGGGAVQGGSNSGGNPGNGGGGHGFPSPTAGTNGLGGGGGAGGYQGGPNNGAAGGNGVVILRMSTSDYNKKTGITGTYSASSVGTDTAITWTASGTIVF